MSKETERGARGKALALLAGRDYTEKKLTEKLAQKGFSPEACGDALQYVKSYGYVSDDRYADRYIELRRNSMSRKQIRMELTEKRGVPAGIAEAALERAGEWDEKPLIRKLADKKLKGKDIGDSGFRKKMTAAFLRKGFLYGDIREVLGNIPEDGETAEW